MRHHSLTCILAASTAIIVLAGCGGGGGDGGGGSSNVAPPAGGVTGNINGVWTVAGSGGASPEDIRVYAVKDDSLGGTILIGRQNEGASTADLANAEDYSRGVTVGGSGFTYTYQFSGLTRVYTVTSMNASSVSGTRKIGGDAATSLTGGKTYGPSPLADALAGYYGLNGGDFEVGLRKQAGVWQVGELDDEDEWVWHDATIDGDNLVKVTLTDGDRIVFFINDGADDQLRGFYVNDASGTKEAFPVRGKRVDMPVLIANG
ncbi:MAG TPA: hypothetical protein VEL07_22650 [Planctomycetota bacterium]|nr:hypothetical protein [Planctomycetota bacterium]